MEGSLTEVAELINFDYTDESRAEFGPVDDTEWWVRFANTDDHTTIYIRLEA